MIIFPAIDIQEGECVRLTKGDFSTAERVAEDPVATALAFQEAGAEWLHMVDLDGAKNGQMQNRDVFVTVARKTELKIQLGGGIRDMKTAAYYLENGIERIILGSIAVRNPKLVAEMVREFGDRIAVGIDAENGMVKIDGWQGSGKVNFLILGREMAHIGVRHLIYTDISRDGTLTGPNLADLSTLRDGTGVNVIASGGISGIGDIRALADLRLYGAICGKSLYRQTLDLREALEVGASSVPVEPTEEVPELDNPLLSGSRPARGGSRPSGNAGRPKESRPPKGGRPGKPGGNSGSGKPPRPEGEAKAAPPRKEENHSGAPGKKNPPRPESENRLAGKGKPRPPRRNGGGRPGGKPPQGGSRPPKNTPAPKPEKNQS